MVGASMFKPPRGSWQIVPFATCADADGVIDVLDQSVVETFLRQYKPDLAMMSHMRDVLTLTDPVSLFSDDEVVRTVAWRLAARQLRFRRFFWRPRVEAPAQETPQPPSEDPTGGAGLTAPAGEEPDPNTFGGDHDGQAQAAALRAAAADGTPFCEECEKQRQAAAA
jgi:hypothetical protein